MKQNPRFTCLYWTLCSWLMATAASNAQVPGLVNYQGRLLDTGGTPVNSNVVVSICIYTGETALVATHTEEVGLVPVVNGIYSFSFGTNETGMVAALANPEAWLEVKIDGVPLTPRQRLVAVPYAAAASTVRGPNLFVDPTSGEVGIGTLSPRSALDVNGKVHVGFKDTPGDFQSLTIHHDADSGGGVLAQREGNDPFVTTSGFDTGSRRIIALGGTDWDFNDATEIYFYTDATYTGTINEGVLRMVITSAGNVGIGTGANPTSILEVKAASGTGFVDSSGNFVDGSSREYKDEIRDLDLQSAQKVLKELDPVRYFGKNSHDDEHLGFIAEDVPDLVAQTGRKGLRAMDIVAVLTKVVQDQQENLEVLKARIGSLEKGLN